MTGRRLLYHILAPLGLYALGRGGLVDAELAAYGAAFAEIERMLADLRREIIPATATEETLSLHEDACGLPARVSASTPSRRALIALRKRRLRSGSAAALRAALEGCGLINPAIVEDGLSVRLSAAAIADGLDAGDAYALALALLPAHLGILAGEDWDALDAVMPDWDILDGLARSWNAFALLGVTS